MKEFSRTSAGIRETVAWSADSIREFCIKNNLYTAGDNRDYSNMLDFVDEKKPTIANQFKVAKDIWEHSDCEILEADTILFMMNRDNAVMRFYNMD